MYHSNLLRCFHSPINTLNHFYDSKYRFCMFCHSVSQLKFSVFEIHSIFEVLKRYGENRKLQINMGNNYNKNVKQIRSHTTSLTVFDPAF